MNASETRPMNCQSLCFMFAPDPVQLYRFWSEHAATKNTLLLESADVVSHKGERSQLIVRAALKVTCRGFDVELLALTPNGKIALRALQSLLANHVVQKESDRMVCRYANHAAMADMVGVLQMPSVFDPLRDGTI